MTATLSKVRPSDLREPKRKWTWAHYLTLIGIPFLVHNLWTIVAWLADGPHQVMAYRDTGSVSWWAARFYEGLSLCVSIPIVVWIVRKAIREHRWTIELSISLVCVVSIWWMDYGGNFFAPGAWQASSQWINVTNPCGHMPFVVHQDCGRSPDPWLFLVPLYLGALPGTMIAAPKFAAWMRRRRPGISWARVLLSILGIGVLIDLLLELPIISLGLWTYVGPAHASLNFGPYRYVFVEVICGGIWWGTLMCLYTYRNDKGQTLFERGVEHVKPKFRTLMTLGSMYGIVMIVNWTVGTIPLAMVPFYNTQDWPKMPAHLVNGVCDAPGFTDTRYGPCPGAPGHRLVPGRHSLPGESP